MKLQFLKFHANNLLWSEKSAFLFKQQPLNKDQRLLLKEIRYAYFSMTYVWPQKNWLQHIEKKCEDEKPKNWDFSVFLEKMSSCT